MRTCLPSVVFHVYYNYSLSLPLPLSLSRGRVHSALQTVVPEPMAPTKVSATNPTAIEETDGLPREEGMEFLESGSHKLFTKFPWERTEDQDDADGDVFLLVRRGGCGMGVGV